ncbi:MAG: IucA/IucC family protein, partial [Paenarthrobacter sp.]
MTTTADAVTATVDSVTHLNPERWAIANRHLVRKAIAEFSHERILVPELIREEGSGVGLYKVVSDDDTTEYRFSARVLQLEHWSVSPESIVRLRDGVELPVDALDFIAEFHEALAIRMEMLPVYLEEISSTLASHAYKQGKPFSSAELAAGVTSGADRAADFQAIEHSMTEGHPCFVANNGRLGFGIADYHAFAPETGATVK